MKFEKFFLPMFDTNTQNTLPADERTALAYSRTIKHCTHTPDEDKSIHRGHDYFFVVVLLCCSKPKQ